MKKDTKQHSNRKGIVIGLTIAVTSLISASSFASTKDWVESPKYIVEDGKVYNYHIVGDNDLVCHIEKDGSCNDDQGRITSVIAYKYGRVEANLSTSTTYQVTVYIFKKGEQTVWHWDDSKKISESEPITAK